MLAIAKNLKPEDRSYDVVTGLSIADINAVGLAKYPPGQELEAATYLKQTWLSIIQKDIYVDWPLGIINGVLFQKGFFNNAPYVDYVNMFLNNATFKRKFSIGVVNANDGKYYTYNETTPLNDLKPYFVASGAIAGFYPFSIIKGEAFIDGSTLFAIDLFTAIQRCLDITGNVQSDIILDAVLLEKNKSLEKNMTCAHSLQMLMRYFEINSFLMSTYYIQDVMRHFPNVNYRYLLTPVAKLPGGGVFGLDYNQNDISYMIDLGEKETTDYIKNHPTSNWKQEISERMAYLKQR